MRKSLVLLLFIMLLTAMSPLSYAQAFERQQVKQESIRQEISDQRKEFHDEQKERRVEFLQNIQNLRKQRKESFKENISDIRDARKRSILERVNNMIDSLNARQTTMMTSFLDRLTKATNRIEERASAEAGKGTDISTVAAAVTQARTSITTAQSAVDAQAAKDYTINVNDETTLADDAHATKEQLKADLDATRSVVRTAQEAVKSARSALQALLPTKNT